MNKFFIFLKKQGGLVIDTGNGAKLNTHVHPQAWPEIGEDISDYGLMNNRMMVVASKND